MRFLETRNITLGRGRQRRAGKKLRPGLRRIAGHESLFTERLFIEEHCRLECGKELLVEALCRQGWRVDTQCRQEPTCRRAVRRRRRDRVRAAVAEQQPSAGAELIARSVSAEVIVVVEEQDA